VDAKELKKIFPPIQTNPCHYVEMLCGFFICVCKVVTQASVKASENVTYSAQLRENVSK